MEDSSNGQVLDEEDVPFGDVPAISEALGELQTQLQDLKSATEHIEDSQEAAQEAVEAAGEVYEATKKLTASTETLIARIDSVNFPERFEEIEEKIVNAHGQIAEIEGKIEKAKTALQRDLEKTEGRLSDRIDHLELLLKVAIASPVIVGLILLLAMALM